MFLVEILFLLAPCPVAVGEVLHAIGGGLGRDLASQGRRLAQLEDAFVGTLYIEPGSPWENGYLESLNGKLRDELLAREVFDSLLEAKVLVARRRRHYNAVRPHSSLGYQPPAPEAVLPRSQNLDSMALAVGGLT